MFRFLGQCSKNSSRFVAQQSNNKNKNSDDDDNGMLLFSCQNHDKRSESRSISKISTASVDVRNELIQQWLLIVMLHKCN